MATAKQHDLNNGAAEDESEALIDFAKRYFRPHLWVRTSRPTPASSYMAVRNGEADFRHVPLPEGLVADKNVINKEALIQVIQDHYQQYEVSTKQFGEILSYTLKFSYDEPGIEFTPDGTMIFPEPGGAGEGDRDTSEKDLAVAQFIGALFQSMDISVEIGWNNVDQEDFDVKLENEEDIGDTRPKKDLVVTQYFYGLFQDNAEMDWDDDVAPEDLEFKLDNDKGLLED